MRILGLSAFYHDSAAALVVDGKIIAAAQEERFTREKHDSRFPSNAIAYCLKEGRLNAGQIDQFVFYDKPLLKFERLLETYVAFAPRGFRSFSLALPVWLKEKLFLKDVLIRELEGLDAGHDLPRRILFSQHHLSHAASAFFPSPFERAAVLTMDGVGEWATTSLAIGEENRLAILKELHFPHSLGLLYSAFTYYLGFRVNSGEYKVMGLAPYGEPRYVRQIYEHLIDVKADGSFRLQLDYFDYCVGLTMTSEKFHRLFGGPPRSPEDPLTQQHADLAASIQQVTEDVIIRLARSAALETGMENLCLAGGVALNCVANGKVLRDGSFRRIWVQPAAGDAGGALGAALAAHYLGVGSARSVKDGSQDAMSGSFLGPAYSPSECRAELEAAGARFRELPDSDLIDACAQAIAKGKIVGWFQGRMEFGPRALGARSILADPRLPEMPAVLNGEVKFRESFRPFAPSVLRSDLSDWFELDADSPYMTLVAGVAPGHRIAISGEATGQSLFDRLVQSRSSIPAVTHIDYSARIQTVHADTHLRYHALLTRFKELTGCPVLINTSFNVRGEPLVCSPTDAFRCFMGSNIDVLTIENFLLLKAEQDPSPLKDFETEPRRVEKRKDG